MLLSSQEVQDGSFKVALIGYLGPVAAVFVGWFLHELSDIFKTRREDRRAIGRALAELLEIRHEFRAVPTVLAEIRKLVPVEPETELVIRRFLNSFLPTPDSLQARYNQAIDLVAGPFPLLAFELRAKEMLGPEVQRLGMMIPAERNAATFFLSMEDEISRSVSPVFEKLLKKMARRHGWVTWFGVRRKLKRPIELPKDFADFIKRSIAEAQKSTAQAPDKPIAP